MVTRGYVLAGGRSQRMGLDKARLAAPSGSTLAAEVAERLAKATGLPATLIRRGAADGLPWLDVHLGPLRVLREPDREPHPLYGVLTALDDAGGPVLTAPCDLPGLTDEALRALLAAGPGSVAEAEGRLQPLLAVWSPADRDRVETAIASGGSAMACVASFRRIELPAAVLANANRSNDLGWAGPLERMKGRVPVWTAQVERGERERLRARGILTRE